MKDLGIKVIGAPVGVRGNTTGAVTSINGSKPDASGNINVATMTEGEKEAILQELQDVADMVENLGQSTSATKTEVEAINAKINDLENKVLGTPTAPDMSLYATKEEVYSLIASIKAFEFVVVTELPAASPDTMNKIYLVINKDAYNKAYYDIIGNFDNEESSDVNPGIYNTADEYITISSSTEDNTFYRWEKIGSTDIDMDGYAKEEKVEEVEEEVDGMKESMNKLLDATFPITIGISASRNGMNHKLTVSVTESGEKYIPDVMTLKQTSYGQTTETETIEGVLEDFKATSGNSLIINTPIKANRETFSLSVSSEGRTPKSTSITRYICYSGALSKDNLDASDIESLTMAYATGVAFNPSITTSDNQYIWLVIPGNLSINKVTSSGFDVTLDNTVTTITTSLGIFKAYRTANQLTENTWNLIIS